MLRQLAEGDINHHASLFNDMDAATDGVLLQTRLQSGSKTNAAIFQRWHYRGHHLALDQHDSVFPKRACLGSFVPSISRVGRTLLPESTRTEPQQTDARGHGRVVLLLFGKDRGSH